MLVAWSLVLAAPHVAVGQVLSGPLLAVLHLGALGWLTMVAIGASCQLLPVALGTTLWSPSLASKTFWVYGAGVGLLAMGFAGMDSHWLLPGATLVWAGLALFLVNVVMTLARVPQMTVTAGYVAAAYASLGVAATLGATMAYDLFMGFAPSLLTFGPPAHAALAVFGWLLPLIVGVSYKLLPMFGLIHGHSEQLARRNGWVWGVALAALAGILITGGRGWPAALTLLVGTMAAFAWDVRRMLKKRMRKAPDTGLRFVGAGLAVLVPTMVLALWPAWGGVLPIPAEHVWMALGLLVFVGGISTIVLGYLHRILPFLQWMRRYGDLAATGPLPRTQDLLNDRVSRACFWPYQAGVVLLAAAALSGMPGAVFVAGVLWAVPATLLSINLLAVLRR
jgi:hypothetical protein